MSLPRGLKVDNAVQQTRVASNTDRAAQEVKNTHTA